MGHPDEGVIRALLDHEQQDDQAELRTHLEGCPECRAVAEAQELDFQLLADALPIMDVDPPEEMARARVMAAATQTAKASRRLGISLPWAASIALLLSAGTLSALPGSPIRHWIAQTLNSPPAMDGSDLEATSLSDTQADPSNLVGATLVNSAEGVTLLIRGLVEGAEVTVHFVDGDQAGIFAGQGTRFRTEDGTLEALDPPGAVRVEIPRGTQAATLYVDSQLFLRRTNLGLEVSGPVQSRTGDEIRFTPSGG